MPTKNQLLKEIEIMKWEKDDTLAEVAHLRKQNKDLLISLRKRGGEVAKLYDELDKTNAALDAYKIGAKEFQAAAEAEIHLHAEAATRLRIDLLHSLTAMAYSNAKKDAKADLVD